MNAFPTNLLSPAALFLFFVTCCLPQFAFAQRITLGVSSLDVGDAQDYFNDVLGNPGDFDSNCDLPRDGFLYEPKTSTNGVWTGVNPAFQGPSVSLLPVPQPGTLLAYYEDCGNVGVLNTIDSGRYRLLSWKQRTSSPSSYSVLWSYDSFFTINGFSQIDGVFLQEAAVSTAAGEWVLHFNDLVSNAPAQTPWAGAITGLTINPNIVLPAGSTTSFDWYRLIDPATSPVVTFNWNSTTAPDGAYVNLYIDEDNAGFDGLQIDRVLPATAQTNFQTGILPPGQYYAYAELVTTDKVSETIVARSAYVGPLTIDGSPRIRFTAPSRMSGSEYSRDEAGNPWDMNDAADIVNLVGVDAPLNGINLATTRFEGGAFYATSQEDLAGGGTVDTHVIFNVPVDKPVRTRNYRYACYRMQVDNKNLPRDGNAVQLNRAGWVARVVYVDKGEVLGSTRAHELVEPSSTYPDLQNGFATYCIDMWNDANIESGPTWKQMKFAKKIRFDPMEATPATEFILDSFGLYAENRAFNNFYRISWEANDPEGAPVTVSLYYDRDNRGFDGTLIGTLQNQSGAGEFAWNTNAVPGGRYYIYAEVSDGTNTTRTYSQVEVIVNANKARNVTKAPGDIDGDGKTDYTVIRRNPDGQATLFSKLTSGGSFTRVFGNADLDLFLESDTDADGLSDDTFARVRGVPGITWQSQFSAFDGLAFLGWGLLGLDVPITPDLDGDNRDDITVFRPVDGTWWSLRSTLGALLGLPWGVPGDFPVAEDYDGDLWDDIAIWRPADAFWWILQSTKGASRAPEDIIVRQFGLPFDYPMPGDYDGDNKADLAIWRPTDAFWFVCLSSLNFDCSQPLFFQFGLPGDIPVKGDYDGDGRLDYSVWRPNGGFWFYVRSSDGGIVAVQWGALGDFPLTAGIRDQLGRLGQ